MVSPFTLDVLCKSKNVEIQGGELRKVFKSCEANNTKYEYVLNDFVFHRNNVAVKLINTDYDVLNSRKHKKILANKIGKTVRTIQKLLDRLIDAGKIIRIGSDKTGYWEVIE